MEHEGLGMPLPFILKDCGSGMNAKRIKVQQLIKMVMSDEVRNVCVTCRDRLIAHGANIKEVEVEL